MKAAVGTLTFSSQGIEYRSCEIAVMPDIDDVQFQLTCCSKDIIKLNECGKDLRKPYQDVWA